MSVQAVLAGERAWAIRCCDVMAGLAELSDESVHGCISSPPYYALRSYLPAGHPDKAQEIGSEPTVDAYVARMVAVFRDVRRVMRPDACLWLNLGDSYATGTTADRNPTTTTGPHVPASWSGRSQPVRGGTPAGLKTKDLIGIPWRVAFALQADGFYLRSAVTICKLNPMPESVQDRPTSATEMLFLLTKNARYAYDSDAIREPASDWGERDRSASKHNVEGFAGGALHPHGGLTNGNAAATGRNKRNWWPIASEPYAGAHFATMPTAVVEPCILAGAPSRVCPDCGAPWSRVVERTPMVVREGPGRAGLRASANGSSGSRTAVTGTMLAPATSVTTGWSPGCTHGREPLGGVVLDPFSGSGTVLMEALRHGRRAIGFDLSETYCKLAIDRITSDAPLFNTQEEPPAPDQAAQLDLFPEAAG